MGSGASEALDNETAPVGSKIKMRIAMTSLPAITVACLLTSFEAPGAAPPEQPVPGKVDFKTQIEPIFASRCYECHGAKKQKGKLRLDDRTLAFNPKKKYIVPGDASASLMVELISLPADDAEIMPNEGDPLTKEQIELIKQWINEGAEWPETQKPADGDAASEGLETRTLSPEQSAAEAAAIQAVEKRGALAMRIAQNTNVVDADFSLLGAPVTDADVALLQGLEPTLVWLNFSRTAITDAALERIAAFTELRRLNLSNTAITDQGLAHLMKLTHLQYLNLYGTKVSDSGLLALKGHAELANLYLWQSQVTEAGANALQAALPGLSIDLGQYALAPVLDPNRPINAKCPLTGKDVVPAHFSLHEGQTIGFCCPDCKAKFDADPAAFIGKVAEFKPAVASQKPINTKCPVTGKDVDPAHFSLYEDQAIAFCCTMCKAQFDKDPKSLLSKIPEFKAPSEGKDPLKESSAPKNGLVNAACPFTGKPAKDKYVFVYQGRRIGFCCPKCLDQFAENPKEHASKVAELKSP